MKKSIASVLCLVMLVSILFAGCGAPATIEGKWKGQIDMAKVLNEQLAQNPDETLPDMHFENITLPVSMEFTAEGDCTLSFEDADSEAMFTAIIDQMMPALESYMESMGMSFDALLALSGMSKDEFMKQLVDGMTASMDFNALKTTEKYKVENGILYTGEDLEDADANPYILDGDKLTIQAGETDAEPETAFLFPLVLERVKES